MSDATHWRGVLATSKRWGNAERAAEADRELRAIRLADAIRCVVDAAPALTPDQIARLRALLPAPGTEAVA